MSKNNVVGLRPVKKSAVLVVDDDPLQVEQIASYLRRRGIDVRGAPDGASALAALAVDRPAVVVMDINMPGMTGIETAREMGKLSYRPKIILVSGEPERVAEANASGIAVFAAVDKPVPLRALEAFIRKALSDRRD